MPTTNNQSKDYYMNRNIKHYPQYMAFTWDLLFIWTISIMYYTTVKGITAAETIILDSVIMFAAAIMAIPLSKLFKNIKPLSASRIANFGYMAFMLIIIFGTSFWVFVIGQLFYSFAISLKSVKENFVITDSLRLAKREKDFSKVYGKGMSIYYIADAVAAILATYMFAVNPYLAMWVALGVVIFAQIYSYILKEPQKFQESNVLLKSKEIPALSADDQDKKVKNKTVKNKTVAETDKKADSYIKLIFSTFILALLLYSFVFRGSMAIYTSAFKMFLQELTTAGTLPLWSFGYIYAVTKIVNALSSQFQFKFDLKWGVWSMIVMTILIIITHLVNGIVYLLCPVPLVAIIVIFISTFVQAALRNPIRIFVTNYMQVCTSKRNMEKVYALRTIADYAGFGAVCLLYSQLLTSFNNSYGWANLIFAGIVAVPLILTLVFFVNQLVKKYAQKYTIVKSEYVDD